MAKNRRDLTDVDIKSLPDDELDNYLNLFIQESNIIHLKSKIEEADGISNEAQEWVQDLSSEIDYIIPFPGIARDIQQWILSTSIYPQPAISFVATMSCLGVLFGRSMAYENIKGNLMYICLAESGEGKDWPFKAVKRIIDAIGKGDMVKDCKHASGAALMESLQDTPSMLFHIDEFGNYLNSINGKNANQYSKEIVDVMTEAYTCCDTTLKGKKLKGMEPIKIIEPNLCVFGLSTERQVFDGLKTSDLANGSLARYSILFGVNGQLPKRVKIPDRVPAHITNKLLEMIEEEGEGRFFIKSTQLKVSDDYDDHKFNLVTRIKKLSNGLEGENANFIPMYNRIAVRCIQQAMLIDRCRSIEVLQWFENLELESVKVFSKKFMHLGSDNESERQKKIVESAIKKAGKAGITKNALYKATRQVETGLRERIMKDLIDSDNVFMATPPGYAKRGVVPLRYYWKK